MKLYNTLSRRKEEFRPIEDGNVKMYACGITVSGEAHIGHAYQALIYDIMRKFLVKLGYKVVYARNYTDVDDKIIAKSKETGIPADAYAKMMIKKIDDEMAALDVGEPDIWLKATENIDNIIDFVSKLIENGHAYKTESGSVYFSVESFPAYGRLSNRKTDDMLDGVRIDNDDEKRSPLDFALWKSAKEGEIFWESPFGKGRPGWHIECSAMNRAAFGERIDIHGGGRDLIFPHHENEIAQSEALTGKPFVKYWIHNGLIKVNGQKMSKSLGNSLLLADLLKKYSNDAIKLALLSTSYRNDINVTDTLFPEAEKHITSFYKVIEAVKKAFPNEQGVDSTVDESFNEAMSDDFNAALAISYLFGYFKEASKLLAAGDKKAAQIVNAVIKTYALLGLFKSNPSEYLDKFEENKSLEIPNDVILLACDMQKARMEKNYATADKLREQINQRGYNVKITKDGYELLKK